MSARTNNLRGWQRLYGLDRRQARRLRRKVARTGETPCWHPDCALLWHSGGEGFRKSPVHYSRTRGPFLAVRKPEEAH